ALAGYEWPGNVRELTNLVERLAVLHPGGSVRVQDLPARYRGDAALAAVATPTPAQPATSEERLDLRSFSFHTPGSGNQPALEHGIAVNRPAAPAALPDEGMDLRNHMANIELGLINEALERPQGVVAHAAQLLGGCGALGGVGKAEVERRRAAERGAGSFGHGLIPERSPA
ncbi:hypothetical protein QCF01_19080, partial [Staphylococcus aureus]|nr:hypothetical protein [Staphylococcus aureus]